MICVDTSVSIKLVIVEERTGQARALFHTAVQANESIVAPQLLLFEGTNTVRQQMRKQNALTLDEARRTLADFLALPIEIHSPPGMHMLALNIADTYALPAVYDAHYLALADLLGCEFWTDDRRLLRQVSHDLPFVRWLGDFGAIAGS